MPGNWNPNQPAAIGLEWLPTLRYTSAVAPGSGTVAQRLRSTQAEAVTGLLMKASGSPSVTAPLFTIVDIYPDASMVPAAGSRKAVYLPPNADQNRGTWLTAAGGTANLWSLIDDTPSYPPGDASYVRQSTAGTSPYKAYVDDSALPAGARVCQVQVRAVIGAQPNPTVTTRQFTIRLEWLPTGDTYTPPNASYTANIYGQLVGVTFGEVNPRTLTPWTRADIAQFNGGNWAVRVEGVGDANTWARLDALSLLVDYIDVENRVAAATWSRTAGAVPEWVPSDTLITLPSGAAGWSKPASGDFAFVWRPGNAPTATGSAPRATDVRWQGGSQDFGPMGTTLAPVPGMAARAVNVDAYGLVSPTGGYGSIAMGLVLVKSGPSYSDDSQPYGVSSLANLSATSSTVVAQRVRQASGTSQAYLGVRFIVAPPTSGSSTLTVTVHAVSGGAQVGGAFTITAAEARALTQLVSHPSASPWRLVEGFLTSAASLANGTQYEIRFTVTGTGTWGFQGPDSSSYGAANYRGTTDTARLGGITLTSQDAAAVLLIQPAAPGSAQARVIPWNVQQATGCGPGTMDQVVVSWTSTSLGAGFARYEVERLAQDGTWHLVAAPDLEADTSWADTEGPRNRPSKYRVRVVATTAAFSAWAETEFVTPEQDGDHVTFTSNAAPELTVMLDHDPSVSFDFPDHDTDESYLPYGADGRVVFFDPVDRGVTKRYRLVVNFATIPHDEGGHLTGDDALWDPLRRITRSTAVPYVAVLDSYGNVTYAHVTLSRGEREQPGDRYWCDADVTPVQFLPTAVT